MNASIEIILSALLWKIFNNFRLRNDMIKLLSLSERKIICLLDQCIKTKKCKEIYFKIDYCSVIDLYIGCFGTVT